MIYEQLQCIGGFIILTGYIKQIRDIYDGASCLGLSLKAYSTVLIGVFLMEFNALNILLKGYGSAFFVTNTITCVITLTSECVIIGENEFPAEEAESRQNQDSFWY